VSHAVSLRYMHYNVARVHSSLTIANEDGKTIKRTPAMAAGLTDHVWTLREIAGLLDLGAASQAPSEPGHGSAPDTKRRGQDAGCRHGGSLPPPPDSN
jgi:alpha-beta hydrolase superfamily lysophospholipase